MNRFRSRVEYLIWFVALATVLGVCMGAWSLTRPQTSVVASPTAGFVGPSTRPSPTPSPSPTQTLGTDALRASALGTLPDEARFITIGDSGDEHVLLLDTAQRRVVDAAHFEGLGVSGKDRRLESTASADGSIVVILSIWDGPDSRLIILRPATGEVRALNIPTSEAPRLSPDARTLAITRSRDPSQRGVWLVDLADGHGTRIVEDPVGRTTSRPIQWSRDGKTLAIVRDANGTDPMIAVVDAASHAVTDLGPGRNARWRADELFFWNESPGSGVRGYDAASGATRVALPVDEGTVIDVLETRPAAIDLATLEHAANARRQLVLHGTAASTLVPDAEFFIAMWWSRDGKHLFVWTTFNGTETVTDVIDGVAVFQFCRRVKVSPPCP